jgi:hypothetical protein
MHLLTMTRSGRGGSDSSAAGEGGLVELHRVRRHRPLCVDLGLSVDASSTLLLWQATSRPSRAWFLIKLLRARSSLERPFRGTVGMEPR